MAKVTKMPIKKLKFDAGVWLKGSKNVLLVTSTTPKSITLEHGGVSMGKHFGGFHEHKPS